LSQILAFRAFKRVSPLTCPLCSGENRERAKDDHDHRENFIWAGFPVEGSWAAQKVITLLIMIISRVQNSNSRTAPPGGGGEYPTEQVFGFSVNSRSVPNISPGYLNNSNPRSS
jgi:hypothetical protein